MKNVCIIFLMSVIITITAFGFMGTPTPQSGGLDEYLRIHIRADSNAGEAQSVKYAVRDRLVAYLTPIVAECESKTEAIGQIRLHLNALANEATVLLQEKGFSYGATAELTQEYFPTRVYEDCTLPAGEYTALIVRLGRGEGDNWWCVVYPPLCFTAQTQPNLVYRSKILEIIADWKARHG